MIISPSPVVPTPTFNPPTPSFADPHVPTNVLMALLSREDPEIPNVSQFRTTTNIVLSCLATIFACTWVALHMNTLRTKEFWWRSFWQRFGCMVAALIAPELIAGVAMSELLSAKEYKEKWNANFVKLCSPEFVTIPGKTTALYEDELKVKQYNSHWTLTHGFLARMGGIRFYNSRDNPQKFKPEQKHLEDPQMQSVIQWIGLISKDNITDKSKGDGITKFFVVLQTIWFIIQCLARWATHLPVTELEVVTLAYAVLNIVIYALWWHKPQSLCDPFRVFVETDSGQVPAREDVEGGGGGGGVSSTGNGEEEKMLILRHSSSSNIVSDKSNALSRSGGGTTLSHLPNELKWVEPTHSGIFFIFEEDVGLAFFAILIGTIFGALHLIPLWLSVFPSDTERKLWQVSAFYITVAPLGSFAATILVTWFQDVTQGLSRCLSNACGIVLAFCGIAAYAVARVILLVLTFTTLRSLPTEAFRNVEWTRFIPHF